MGAALHHATVLQDDDEIRPPQRAQPVRHDEGRAAGDGPVKRLENLVLGLAVNGGRRIVEQHDGRLQQHGARDGEPLALATRQALRAFAEQGVVALGQRHDEVVRRGHPRRLLDLLPRRIRMTEGDVGRNRVGKEEAFLENQTDVPTHVVEVERAHIVAVEQHATRGRIEEPRDQAHEDALAGAGRAEDGHTLARPHVQFEVAHDRLGPGVGEGDVIESHRAVELRPAEGVGRILHLDRRVEDFEHPPRADEGLLHAVHDGGDVVHLAGELFKQARKDHEARAERQLVVSDEPAAIAEQHHHVDAGQKTDGRGEKAHPPENAALLVEAGLVGRLELGPRLGLAAKALGHRRAHEVFGEHLHHFFHERAVLGVGRLDPAREGGRHEPEDGRGRQAGNGQRRAEAGHVDDIGRERNPHDHALDQDLIDKHAHRLHVARHPGDDRAGGVGVEEAEAQPLQLVVDLAAQVHDELLLHEPVDRDRVGVVEHGADEGEEQDQPGQQAQHAQRRPVVRQREVQRVGAEGCAVHFVADEINAKPGETQPADTKREQHELDAQHLQAMQPVTPGQAEQAPDQRPVVGRRGGGGFGGGAHEPLTLGGTVFDARSIFRRARSSRPPARRIWFFFTCSGGL